MIKYEDIIKRIANIEKKKIKNEERIKLLSEENNTLNSNLKILNQKKEMLEKMDQDLADLIPDKKSVKRKSDKVQTHHLLRLHLMMKEVMMHILVIMMRIVKIMMKAIVMV